MGNKATITIVPEHGFGESITVSLEEYKQLEGEHGALVSTWEKEKAILIDNEPFSFFEYAKRNAN